MSCGSISQSCLGFIGPGEMHLGLVTWEVVCASSSPDEIHGVMHGVDHLDLYLQSHD